MTRLLTERGVAVTALSLDYPDGFTADRVLTASAMDERAVVTALEGVDAVVHLAAIPHRDLGTPHDVYVTNVTSTFTVLAHAAERGVPRAVVASSINAFGVPLNPHDVLPLYFPIDEEIPTDLADWYSLSKRSDELTAAMVARRWGMAVVAFRFPRVDTEAALHVAARRSAERPEDAVREGWSYLDLRDAAEAVYLGLVAPLDGAVVLGLSAGGHIARRADSGPPGSLRATGTAPLTDPRAAVPDRYQEGRRRARLHPSPLHPPGHSGCVRRP